MQHDPIADPRPRWISIHILVPVFSRRSDEEEKADEVDKRNVEEVRFPPSERIHTSSPLPCRNTKQDFPNHGPSVAHLGSEGI